MTASTIPKGRPVLGLSPVGIHGQLQGFLTSKPNARPRNWLLSSELTRGDRGVLDTPSSRAAGIRPSSSDTGTRGCAYRGQLVKLAEELVEQLHQLLCRALRRQAREAHDVREEDAARQRALPPEPT